MKSMRLYKHTEKDTKYWPIFFLTCSSDQNMVHLCVCLCMVRIWSVSYCHLVVLWYCIDFVCFHQKHSINYRGMLLRIAFVRFGNQAAACEFGHVLASINLDHIHFGPNIARTFMTSTIPSKYTFKYFFFFAKFMQFEKKMRIN